MSDPSTPGEGLSSVIDGLVAGMQQEPQRGLNASAQEATMESSGTVGEEESPASYLASLSGELRQALMHFYNLLIHRKQIPPHGDGNPLE